MSGRRQEEGGFGAGGDDYDNDSKDKKDDSTVGKLMEKAGGMFKSDKLEQKGREKRDQTGGFDDTTNY